MQPFADIVDNPLGDTLLVRWDEKRAPERTLAVAVNRATNQAQVIMLKNSHPVPDGTITLSSEQFLAHIVGCIKVYEMLQGTDGRQKLVLPSMIGGKPLIP